MAYSTKLFIIFLCFVAVLFGYNYVVKPFAELVSVESVSTDMQQSSVPVTISASTEEKILNSMSVRQRVAQVLVASVTINLEKDATSSSELEWINTNQPGFVLVFGKNISTTSANLLKSEIARFSDKQLADILIAVDHEGGTVQRYAGEGFTRVPSWSSVCDIENETERKELLNRTFRELKEVGISVILGPVFDTKVTGSPLGSRACSTDQAIISERVKEYITILNAYKILPVVKHFPNIGFVKRDLHTNFDTIGVKTDDLLAFKNILTAFPSIGVMTTHVGVTNQNPTVPCSLSADCINELLVNYPAVLVVSDALEMSAAQGFVSTSSAQITEMPELTKRAIRAGNEVIILGESVDARQMEVVLNNLEEAYNKDESFKQLIDTSVKKILKYKQLLHNAN